MGCWWSSNHEETAMTGVTLDVPAPFVAVVTLDRPPVNALNRPLREHFTALLEELHEREDIRCIVLAARGKLFCAGADIKEKQALGTRPGDLMRADRVTRDAFFTLLDISKPVIAAVQGGALGAGFVLAACCDIILASEEAYFAMPEIDVGQGGGASFLQRILPPAKLRRMMLTGERVPAAEMHRLGAVESVLPASELRPAAVALASVIAEKSPTAVRRIRSSFGTVEALGLREGFRVEQAYTTDLSRSADAEEARAAFFAKRRPNFGGNR
jgi:enoyl-CoA hydratase